MRTLDMIATAVAIFALGGATGYVLVRLLVADGAPQPSQQLSLQPSPQPLPQPSPTPPSPPPATQLPPLGSGTPFSFWDAMRYLSNKAELNPSLSGGATTAQRFAYQLSGALQIIGAKVEWVAEVRDVLPNGTIALRCNPATRDYDVLMYPDVSVVQDPNFPAFLLSLRRGERVKVWGTVSGIGSDGKLILVNGRVVARY